MLTHVDRIQVAVRDRAAAAETYRALFDAETKREDELTCLGAARTVVQLGVSDVELLQPVAEGPVQNFLTRWGEGLFAAGFRTPDLTALTQRLSQCGIAYSHERGQVFLGPEQTRGLRVVLTPTGLRQPVGEKVRFLYEVTNIVDDCKEAAKFYAAIFGLDESRFHALESDLYGYVGILTLFDPARRLDRIELTQITAPNKPMGRFKARRGGPCLYMSYLESPDPASIIKACSARGVRWAPHGPNDDPRNPEGLYVHPAGTHGVLIGVSRPRLAWRWSGQPDRAD